MSDAKKCDRCGKLYDNYDGRKVQEGGNSYIKLALLRGWNDSFRQYDLCPECIKLLIKWIKEADNETDN